MDIFEILAREPLEVAAKALLGRHIERMLDGQTLATRIVEVEAYHQSDPASHTFRGPSPRNQSMFGPAGHAYVYFTYGMHHCLNVTAGKEGEGAGILIRALEPLEGLETMAVNRVQKELNPRNLCSGPGKLTQALAIDLSFNGHDLTQAPLELKEGVSVSEHDIITTARIGISKAIDTPWRFYLKDNPYISKP